MKATLILDRVCIWSAATPRRFPTPRHVAEWESADLSTHSKLRHYLILARLIFALGLVINTQPALADSTNAFIFTSFNNTEQNGLRFLYSYDAYHWTNVPGKFLVPSVGPNKILRDPSISQGPDGVFHLVWTCGWHGDDGFGYASSRDLVHWSAQQYVEVMKAEPATVNVWAPELFYDQPSGLYYIIWSSTIPGRFPDHLEPHTNNHRAYYTTTRDFKTFTPGRLFFDQDYSVIDGFMVRDGARYVFINKDNTRPNRNLRVAFGDSPLGPWSPSSPAFTEKFTEGPAALKVGDDWLIYFDAYEEKIYGAVKTRDFKTFVNITKEVSFPEGHKHGTAIRVDRTVLDYLLSHAADK